jgi:serine phosphatase RsbU (regulator of sigma subunit)
MATGAEGLGERAAPSDEQVWRLATALSGAATRVDVARALAEEGAAAAGSTFSNMAVLDPRGSRLRVAHGSVLDDAIAARWAEFDLAEPTPLCSAVRSGHAVLLGSPEAIGSNYPNLVTDTLSSGLRATASLPLLAAAGVPLGAIGFGWPAPQTFDQAQLRRLDLIAHMAAQALDRALLYERERAQSSARERAEAQLLQEAFLPATLPHTDGLEMAAAYLPASDAPFGGDWYDAFPVDEGVFLVIGDVAGHGMPAAATMAQLRNAVRAFADEDPAPERVLTRLNRMFCRLNPGETATAIVAMWDPASATLLRSNAGHPPVLRCRQGEVEFLVPPPGGLLLGAQATCYQAESKLLRPGTTLLFYTDGLVEMRGHSLDQGMRSLRAFVDGLADLSPQALCDGVIEWRLAAGRREDDMCLLAVRLS